MDVFIAKKRESSQFRKDLIRNYSRAEGVTQREREQLPDRCEALGPVPSNAHTHARVHTHTLTKMIIFRRRGLLTCRDQASGGRRTIRSTVGTLRGMLQVNEHERGCHAQDGGERGKVSEESIPQTRGRTLVFYTLLGVGALGRSSTPCQVLKPVTG